MEEFSDNLETLVRLPNCGTETPLPKGWTSLAGSTPLTLVGPEQDLRVVLLTASVTASMEEIATHAWQQADRGIYYPTLQQAEVPSTQGWDKVFQIVYNIPAAERRTALAIIRTWTIWPTSLSLMDRRPPSAVEWRRSARF